MITMPRSSQSGFTLIELVFVIALIGVMVASSFALRLGLVDTVQADAAIQSLGAAAHRAQGLSVAMKADDQWGVHMDSTAATVFRGATWDGHDTAWDEVYQLPATVVPSGDVDIVFEKGRGMPATSETAVMTYHDATRSLTISVEGLFTYAHE